MGRKSSKAPIDRRVLLQMLLIAALGGLGWFDLESGAADAHGLLAWLTLLAIPAGIGSAAGRARFWPYGLLVPAIWSFLMVFSSLASAASLPSPLSAMAVLAGLFFAGFGLGCCCTKGVLRPAAIALFSLLLLVGSAQRGGLARPGAHPAQEQPGLARRLVDLSPLVLSYESAGLDWTHANPSVYAQSGVEWFPRKAYDAETIGPGVLLIGALLAFLADRRRGHPRVLTAKDLETPTGD